MTLYTCKACGAPASVANGTVTRTCAHTTAGVLASIKATATGKSSTGGGGARVQ